MFGINKKIKEMQDDPKKALEHADKTLNKGVSGFMTKTFMGKDFTDKMNAGLNTAKKAMDVNNLSQTGMPGSATVTSIADTGQMINYDPIVTLGLDVQPAYGVEFKASGNVMVSKIAVPRVGDKINIKYSAVNPNEFVIVA